MRISNGANKATWWSQHREASLNWLALGMLLAAWNTAENDSSVQPKRRPDSLRGYTYVSVRAQRSALQAERRLPMENLEVSRDVSSLSYFL